MLEKNEMFENLLSTNKVDYEYLKEHSYIKLFDSDIEYDINMIIPINGRVSFLKPLYKSFLTAKNKSNLKICLTVVEISEINNQREYCELNNINYIFNESDIFNKSLAMNLGAIFSMKSKSFIFHDLDCLLDVDFFNKIEENIENKGSKVLQCFHDRRIFYLNDELTKSIINEEIGVIDLSPQTEGVMLDPTPVPTAPGGSIYIDKDIFFEVGGYDPEFFIGYAPEDAFFWDKVELLGYKIESCDNPNIFIYHMNHDKILGIEFPKMVKVFRQFYYEEIGEKLNIVLEKKNILISFYNGDIIPNKLEMVIIEEFFNMENLNDNLSDGIKKRKNIEPIEIKKVKEIKYQMRVKPSCKCGEPFDKRNYNFCQRCGKLY